jgi:hypothetical protein
MRKDKYLELRNSRIQRINGYNEVFADINVTASTIQNNTFTTGLPNNIIHSNPIKNVGGGLDFYQTIQGALNGITSDGQKIVLNSNQNLTTYLQPPNYEIFIDGLNQYDINRAGQLLMLITSSKKVRFSNIDLNGEIRISASNSVLQLNDHAYLEGQINVSGGTNTAKIILNQSIIKGDKYFFYPLKIADADPFILIKRAYLKGFTGYPAIYYNTITNDNLDIEYSTIMHGSLGTNDAFGRSGVQTPTISSHHSAYNTNPKFTINNIDLNYDTFDADADYGEFW